MGFGSFSGHDRVKSDDDLASRVAPSDLFDRLRGIGQRVGSIDDRCDLTGFYHLREGRQILVLLRHEKPPQSLAHESKRHHRADQATPAGNPAMVEPSAVRNEHPLWSERTPEARQRKFRRVVENEVVPFAVRSEEHTSELQSLK